MWKLILDVESWILDMGSSLQRSADVVGKEEKIFLLVTHTEIWHLGDT